MDEILQYLKTHGESHDTRIADVTGHTLTRTRELLTVLASKNEIMVCYLTRFDKGKKSKA